jgi:hypothetical protein
VTFESNSVVTFESNSVVTFESNSVVTNVEGAVRGFAHRVSAERERFKVLPVCPENEVGAVIDEPGRKFGAAQWINASVKLELLIDWSAARRTMAPHGCRSSVIECFGESFAHLVRVWKISHVYNSCVLPATKNPSTKRVTALS